MIEKFQMFLKHGGVPMMVNFAVLAIVIAIIADRSIYFLGRGHINARRFLEQIKRLLAANNIDRAKKLCDATSAPIARVAKAGLSRAHKGEAAVAQSIEETMIDVQPELKKRIGALWSLANIATLIGLIGTVFGLINTFDAIGGAAPADRQRLLAEGIAEALFNTAMGLIIAVLCMIGHLLLSSASKKVVADLESFTLRLENMLSEGSPAGAGGTPHQAPEE